MAGVAPVSEHLAQLLSAYLDGELTKDELREVVDALETNTEAVATFRQLQATRRVVRTLPALDPPLELLPGGHLGDQLSAYLDGELVTAEVPIVTSHLESCSDCRRELADVDRSRIAVRALPGVEPPAFLVASAAPAEDESELGHRRRLRRRASVAVAAGVAAIVLMFTLVPIGGNDEEPSAVSIVELSSRHNARASTGIVPSGVQVESP